MTVVENLDVYLADWGEPVSFTGSPAGAVGILDFHDVHVLGDRGHAEVNARVFGVRLKTSVAASLKIDQAITVGGTPYFVNDPTADRDGAFTVVGLRTA